MRRSFFQGFKFLISLMLTAYIGIHSGCSSSNLEEQSVIRSVEQFLTALESRDVDLAQDTLLPEGAVFSVREEAGEKTIRFTPHHQLLNSLANSEERMQERIWEPKILIHREIAVVWAKYDFYRGGRFSHCGLDAFNLIKTPQGWKISGIIYTVETEGCEKSPLGPPE